MQKMRFQLSLDIVHCDGFVSMPATAQALYVQIVSTCDDEGFTSQIEMCKFLAHASDDDVKTLIDREFIFQVGDRKVTVVKHWKMNTYLHEGKINPSKFAERSSVFLKPSGNYTLNSEEGKPLEECINESKRNENGMRTESLRNTSPSRVGQGARAPHAGSNPIQSNTLQSNTNQSIPNQKIKLDRTRYKQPALLEILVDSGYVDEDEIAGDCWDDLLDSYSKSYGWLDVKIKLKYFISKVCHIDLKEDEYGNITFSRKWDGKPFIENRYLYFKSSMDNSFKRFAIGQEPDDDDPLWDERERF